MAVFSRRHVEQGAINVRDLHLGRVHVAREPEIVQNETAWCDEYVLGLDVIVRTFLRKVESEGHEGFTFHNVQNVQLFCQINQNLADLVERKLLTINGPLAEDVLESLVGEIFLNQEDVGDLDYVVLEERVAN